jgi:two-component system, chemotaxis family, response regulator WspF
MKIGIVSERPQQAHTLHRAISLDPAHLVAWIAETGTMAIERCAAERPDLILLDLPSDGSDGVDVIRRITESSHCPILVVTDSVRGNASSVLGAIGGGAFDAVDIPMLDADDLHARAAVLLEKIDAMSKYAVPLRAPAKTGDRIVRRACPPRADVLVTIGASAGGPAAVATVLRGLPLDFPAAIVVVQHVDEGFVAGMAQWLSEQSGREVKVAREGERPSAARVLLAGGRGHLELKGAGRLTYTQEPRGCSYRPSVDVFFHSASRTWSGPIVGVLLTGMGKDGALGLKALRDKGHHTIAQDRASSAIYGMPKAAIALNAAADIRPLDRIAASLITIVEARATRIRA